MKKIKENLLYYLVLILNFYLLPLLIRDTGSGMLVLLILVPLICLITSILYGKKNGFNILYSLFVALLFIPSIFIYYNSSAMIYILAYGVIACIGSVIGDFLRKA